MSGICGHEKLAGWASLHSVLAQFASFGLIGAGNIPTPNP